MLFSPFSSPDFFDVESHPTATFVIDTVEGNTAKGKLTIRGNTGEETITDLVASEENGEKSISGKLVFNRKNYDVSYSPVKEMVLSNDVTLDIRLVLD